MMMTTEVSNALRREFESLVRTAYLISTDVGEDVEAALREEMGRPLDREAEQRLVTQVVAVMRDGLDRLGIQPDAHGLRGETSGVVDRVMREIDAGRAETGRVGSVSGPNASPKRKAQLISHNGVKPGPVTPQQVFHGQTVPLDGGYVRTSDLDLWDENERLEIHLAQFEKAEKRKPSSDELLKIMLDVIHLPGATRDEDPFAIPALARSIAANGVQKPPILDKDGILIDGNRRVAACIYILMSKDFDAEEKRRVEYVYVWQLSLHSTPEDRANVIVGLNFEDDHKKPWPYYVKARKVFAEYESMVCRELGPLTDQRDLQIRRSLAKDFALPLNDVTRYLYMMGWANDFKEYHIIQKHRDNFEAEHRVDAYFQYFDELNKGRTKPDGVATVVGQDEGYKGLVFDLLYDGKFKDWKQIRDLKTVYYNDDAMDLLKKARDEDDAGLGREIVADACSLVRARRAEQREVGANTKIEGFVKWLEELPVRAFRDDITPENKQGLLRALRLVEKQCKPTLMVPGRSGRAPQRLGKRIQAKTRQAAPVQTSFPSL